MKRTTLLVALLAFLISMSSGQTTDKQEKKTPEPPARQETPHATTPEHTRTETHTENHPTGAGTGTPTTSTGTHASSHQTKADESGELPAHGAGKEFGKEPVPLAHTAPLGQKLDAGTSISTIHQVNDARSNLKGLNSAPLPEGVVTTRANGSLAIATANGHQVNVRPNGTILSVSSKEARASFAPDGTVRNYHSPSLDLARTTHGTRIVETSKDNKTKVVSYSAHAGYVEKPVNANGHKFVVRNTMMRGKNTTSVFSDAKVHGVHTRHYIPRHRFWPPYYGWVYYGWGTTAHWRWRWAWVNVEMYFVPAEDYSTPSDWLADYVLGDTVSDGTAQDTAANTSSLSDADADAEMAASETDAPVTPTLQREFSSEVEQQLSYENLAATSPENADTLAGLPQALVVNHIFLVNAPLVVETADEQTCSLSAGALIRLLELPTDQSPEALVNVAASRKGDCAQGTRLYLTLPELAEMENSYRQKINEGLGMLYEQQGKNGLPTAPANALARAPTIDPAYDGQQQNIQSELNDAQNAANQAETQAAQLATDPSTSN